MSRCALCSFCNAFNSPFNQQVSSAGYDLVQTYNAITQRIIFDNEANYENTTTPCLVRSPRGYMYKIRRGARVPMSSKHSF